MQFRWASVAMSAIILTAVLSCLNSAFYVCSRVLFVLAEHGDAPQFLVQLNERRVPTRSVLMGSIAGVLGIFAATAHSQAVFAFLVNASGALIVFIYMMIVVAHLRVRREREASGAPQPALTMWLFPWANYGSSGRHGRGTHRDGSHARHAARSQSQRAVVRRGAGSIPARQLPPACPRGPGCGGAAMKAEAAAVRYATRAPRSWISDA